MTLMQWVQDNLMPHLLAAPVLAQIQPQAPSKGRPQAAPPVPAAAPGWRFRQPARPGAVVPATDLLDARERVLGGVAEIVVGVDDEGAQLDDLGSRTCARFRR